MLFSTSGPMSAELNELVQFSKTLSLTEEKTLEFEQKLIKLDERLKFQRRSFDFLKQSFAELNHLIKHLVFDLVSTKRERDRLEATIKRLHRTDSSN